MTSLKITREECLEKEWAGFLILTLKFILHLRGNAMPVNSGCI